jgi:hypothetical protein
MLCYERKLDLEPGDKARAIGEVDLQLRPITTLAIEITGANDFSGKLFTFDHESLANHGYTEPYTVYEDIHS